MINLSTLAKPIWRLIEKAASRRGYAIEWRPDCLHSDGRRLRIDFEFALAHLLACKRMPFFVEVGANDGKSNDPIYPFAIEGLISGIALEPVPSVFDKLKANYANHPDILCINAALSSVDGEADFFTVDMTGINFDKAHQFSSFKRDSIIKQTSWVPDISDRIIKTKVRTVSFGTLSSIAEQRNFRNIDILHTDTEGFDSDILNMMWDSGIRPCLVSFEKLHMPRVELSRQISRFADAFYMSEIGDADVIAYRAPRRFTPV